MQQAETRLVEAQRLLDKGQYTEASGFVQRLVKPRDFRYADFARRAQELIKKCEGPVSQYDPLLQEISPEFRRLAKERKYSDALALIAQVPRSTLDDELNVLVRQCEVGDQSDKN